VSDVTVSIPAAVVGSASLAFVVLKAIVAQLPPPAATPSNALQRFYAGLYLVLNWIVLNVRFSTPTVVSLRRGHVIPTPAAPERLARLARRAIYAPAVRHDVAPENFPVAGPGSFVRPPRSEA
jgi:hypothetical protein